MSSASVTSSKRGGETSDLQLELESVRALNKSLRTYLDHILIFKRNLYDVNKNFQKLQKVNIEWIENLESSAKRLRRK